MQEGFRISEKDRDMAFYIQAMPPVAAVCMRFIRA